MVAPSLHWREAMHTLARILLVLLVILVFLTMLGGCGYSVHMRSVQVQEHLTVPTGASVWVESSPDSPAADNNPFIKEKIEQLLTDGGFQVAGKEVATHYLFFEQHVDSLVSRMSLKLTTGIRGGISSYQQEGPFDRSISMRVVEAKSFEDGVGETIWASTAMIRAAPTVSPKFDDLLLLATFKHFPEDSGETVIERINLESKQAHRLR